MELKSNDTGVRVRFAPSPTGYLHIGGARTALFNWLYARHTGGTFILRIEDTDAARNTTEATQVIFDGLRWLGLDWDEGPESADPGGAARGEAGPYFQSRRGAVYQRRIEELLDRDLAYRDEGAVKFRMSRDPITIDDAVVGKVTRELTNRERENPDFVIVRSDGQPVFHLVNVIDDLEMGITHVIRGEDHLSNTSRHIALFKAFGVKPPVFAHIPLILNNDGSKMSKRDVGASLDTYQREGYAPEAVVNYLCLLGWSPKDNREILSIQELAERFDLPGIGRSNARFDLDKLQWMNCEYIKGMTPDRFREMSVPFLRAAGFAIDDLPDEYVNAALMTCREKIKRFVEIPDWTDFYFLPEPRFDEAAVEANFTPENRPRLQALRDAYATVEPFDADALQGSLKAVASGLGVKNGVLVHPARVACTGRKVGPSLYHLFEVLGKDRVLARFDAALNRMRE